MTFVFASLVLAGCSHAVSTDTQQAAPDDNGISGSIEPGYTAIPGLGADLGAYTRAGDVDPSSEGGVTTSEECLSLCDFRECGDTACVEGCGLCTLGFACSGIGHCVADTTGRDLVLFVYDDNLGTLFRLEDLNGDGDYIDRHEAMRFFDYAVPELGVGSATGLLALAGDEVLAADAEAPSDIVRLIDRNGDGDALDRGESSVWFSGVMPDGRPVDGTVALSAGRDRAFYLVTADTRSSAGGQTVLRLTDRNGDGDADDAGEVEEFAFLAAPELDLTQTPDIELDVDGAGFVVQAEGGRMTAILQLGGGDVSSFADADSLRQLTDVSDAGGALRLDAGSPRMGYSLATGDLIIALGDDERRLHFAALRDVDDSGAIDQIGEARSIWDELDALGSDTLQVPPDFSVARDGSIVFLAPGEDRVLRLIDRNDDGDFNDADESIEVYQADAAATGGTGVIRDAISISAALR